MVDTLSGAAATTSGMVRIRCDSLLFVNICAGIGAGSGGILPDGTRLLTGPGGTLRYQLYQDAAMTTVWGSVGTHGVGSVPVISLGGGVRTEARPIYARIFPNQSTSATGTFRSSFTGTQTGFQYGEVALLNCAITLLGSVARPTFEVRAEVRPNCLVEADDLTFGSHGVLDRNIDAATRIRVRCTPGTGYSIGLGEAGSPAARFMRSGADRIGYTLFQNEGRTVPWVATGGPGGIGDGAQGSFSVYGRVPPQATPPAGTYNDTVPVTVTYD